MQQKQKKYQSSWRPCVRRAGTAFPRRRDVVYTRRVGCKRRGIVCFQNPFSLVCLKPQNARRLKEVCLLSYCFPSSVHCLTRMEMLLCSATELKESSPKLKSHNLLTLMLFQTCTHFFLLLNKKDRVSVTYNLSHRSLSLQWQWMVTDCHSV